MTTPTSHTAAKNPSLQQIWPLGARSEDDPTVWHTIARKHGSAVAARMMVIYPRIKEFCVVEEEVSENVAWTQQAAYTCLVTALRDIVMSENAPPAALLGEVVLDHAMHTLTVRTFNERKMMIDREGYAIFEGYLRTVALKEDTPAAPDIWELDAFDSARYDNLARWGWGVDATVPCDFAFASELQAGVYPSWKAVHILRHPNGRCESNSLDDIAYLSPEDAMRALGRYVESAAKGQAISPQPRLPKWDKPIRSNRTSPNSSGRTLEELSSRFSFASVSFIDTASRAHPETVMDIRQNLVDALYDGFFDLVDTTGMPLNFASIYGKLKLEIGFDVHGLYPHGIHYDPVSYTLRAVVDGAQELNLSRAFATALDHILSFTVQYRSGEIELESSHLGKAVRDNGHYLTTYSRHFGANYADISAHEALKRGFLPVMRAYAGWNEYLGLNRTSQQRPEWVQRCVVEDMGRSHYSRESGPSELFGRGFENLIQVVMQDRAQENHLLSLHTDEDEYWDPHETFELSPLGRREQSSAAVAFSKVIFALRDFWLNDPVAATSHNA